MDISTRKPRDYWTIEKLRDEALKFNTMRDFVKYSYGAYIKIHKINMVSVLCSHMKKAKINWTEKTLHDEALKYSSRGDFCKKSKKAYEVSYKKGKQFLDKICSHMSDKYIYWTNSDLITEASLHKTISEFKRTNASAYKIVHSRGLATHALAHMDRSQNSSLSEKLLFEYLKKQFPTVKKMKDRNVQITGKSFIKGFDIDIFIPELNKGIEFDGKYHHSFEFMRNCKQKSKWSDIDIYNYHTIKDKWFLNKGISILHIKEVDWLKDQQSCIEKCEKFLKCEKLCTE